MTSHPRIVVFALAAAAFICAVCLRSAETQSSLRRITNTTEEGININPSVSGDGRFTGFESTEDVAGAGGTERFRAIRANISVDPATFFQMGGTRAVAPGISQDGSRLTFASKDDPLGTNADGNSEIFLFNGSSLVQVTNTTPSVPANRISEGNFQPSISDDGRFVAFSSNRNLASQNADGNLEIFVFDSSASTFTQLTNTTGTVGFSDAKISGDGLAVASVRDQGATASNNRDLIRINRSNSAQSVLAAGVLRLTLTYGRAISDDGTRIVYSAETAANTTQVFFYDGRSGNISRQVTTLGARATEVPLHPTISGDGRRIAFAARRAVTGFSNSDASVELYTYDIPTTTFARITNASSSDADCFDGTSPVCEVVSSLNDDGSTVVFNFPRALSGAVTEGLENKSEIYATGVGARPPFGTLTSILNQASFGHEPSPVKAVAPNSIAAVFGSALANTTQQSQKQPNGNFPTNVGGTTVTVNGRAAQIFFVSPDRVHFLVPAQTEIGSAEVVITNADGFASRGNVPILLAAPGIFTKTADGLGEGVILDTDTQAAGPFDPSSGNLRLSIFSTGVRNAVVRTVNIGGRVVTAEAVNPSTEMPGLDEVVVRVPSDLRGTGIVNLSIQADGRDSNPVTVRFTGDPSRNIVINEVLADPPDGVAGDANHDGVRDGTQDEFIELVNGTNSEVINLSGWTIRTQATAGGSETTRFSFASGTSLPAGAAIVVFGGGSFNPGDPVFGCAQVVKATTSAGLSLTNSGLTIIIRDASGNLIKDFSYGGSTGLAGDNNQSLTRSPDVTGAFVQHTAAAPGSAYSPGTRTNGAPFTPCPSAIARIEVTPSSATIEAGQQQQFTARAFDSNNNEVAGVTFTWQSSNTAVATIDQNGLATSVETDQTNITASARGVSSAPAVLNVNPAVPVLTSVTISPASATIGAGETQQFIGQAKDQFGNDIGGVTVTFTSSNTTVATVDSTTATSSTGSATATVTGQTSGSAQITAHATNGSITVNSTPATLTVEPSAGQLVISEFRTRGPAGASDEFVEIYNPTTSSQVIGGLKIRASNDTGTISDRVTITAGTTLGSGCHYLVVNSSASGYSGATPPNQTYTTGITNQGGIAITRANGTTIIDQVGMSAASAYKEGTPLADLTANVEQSYERKPGGSFGNGTDTNHNSADFFLNASSSNPQNSSSGCIDVTAADLEITKTDSPDPVIVGSNVTYTITVTNYGPAAASSVVVTDNLPANVTFVSCTAPGGTCNAGTGNNRTVTYASIAAGGSQTITLVATANGPAGTPISNTATVNTSTTDANVENNSASTTTDVNNPTVADLALSKSDSPDPVFPTQTLTYTLTLTNNGPDTAQSVVVTDSLPSEVTFVNCASDQGGVCGGTTTSPTVSFTSLASGVTATITLNVTVNANVVAATVITNNASVASPTGDSNGSNNSAQTTTTVQEVSAGQLVISEFRTRGPASASDEFVEIYNPTTTSLVIGGLKIRASNGSGTITDRVTITAGTTLGAGCHYLVANSSASGYSGATAANQTYTTGITDDGGIAITRNNGTTIIDQVGMSAGSAYKEGTTLTQLAGSADQSYERKPGGSFGNGTDTDNNSADFLLNASSSNPQNLASGCLNTTSADLFITKADSPDPVTIGSNITYTITVLNNGAATAQNVVVTDNLPAEVTFVSCAATGGAACGGSGNARTVTLASLASGASFTVTLVATANGPNGNTASNTATVSSTTPDANSSNNSATTTTLMQDPLPILSIDDVTLAEGTGGTTNFVFTVTLTPASSQTVTVNYATSSVGATAAAGTDYNSTSGMLTFTPSDTSEQITVQVIGDSANEAICETFFVKLSSPVNGALPDDTGLGSITDDDGTKLVISQVYGGGGNSGATYTHDFIEIFNRGNTPTSLNGLSVQYSAATSTSGSFSVTTLPNVTLQPGQYFLIQEASAGAVGIPLPTPDATGTIAMSATAGKVALVNGTSALSAVGCPSGATILDFVGYGTTANCREGASTADNAGAPSASTSDQRKLAGCQDTGNNNTDFTVATPSARNTSSAIGTCTCSTSYSSQFIFAGDAWKGSLAKFLIDRKSPWEFLPNQ